MIKKSTEKKNEKITKKTKEKSKYGLSAETLERILEEKSQKADYPERGEHESILSEEELKTIPKRKNKDDEEDETTIIPQQRRIFLEREINDESSSQTVTGSQQNRNQNSFEYTPINNNSSEGEKKYINYEPNPNIKFESAREISKSWSNPLQGREVGFISSHPEMNNQKTNYETYTNPKRFSEEEMRDEAKKSNSLKFISNEAKMHYYKD